MSLLGDVRTIRRGILGHGILTWNERYSYYLNAACQTNRPTRAALVKRDTVIVHLRKVREPARPDSAAVARIRWASSRVAAPGRTVS
jgi:hypothetical protein